MMVSEIFTSWQGEGKFVGTPSVFLRLAGCNLRCVFCDTTYALHADTGGFLNPDEIIHRIRSAAKNPLFPALDPEYISSGDTRHQAMAYGVPEPIPSTEIRHVVITGGEPFLHDQLPDITSILRQDGFHVTVETAGTLYDKNVLYDLCSVSPKMSNSTPTLEPWRSRHERTRIRPEVVEKLIRNGEYQLKFVIHSEKDFSEVEAYLAQMTHINRHNVMLMPEGRSRAEVVKKTPMIQSYCQAHGVGFSPRAQLFWFQESRGV